MIFNNIVAKERKGGQRLQNTARCVLLTVLFTGSTEISQVCATYLHNISTTRTFIY